MDSAFCFCACFMLKVGLTGGIGCGKSTVIRQFQALAIPVVDADVIARAVVQPGQAALQEIVDTFGVGVLQADGELDRAKLRQQVFGEPEQLARLEAILHPRIRAGILTAMQEAAQQGAPYIVVDVPLLLEKGYRALFDRIVVVDCFPEQQRERVSQRDGSSLEVIDAIMQRQISRQARLQAADDVIENTGSLPALYEKIMLIHHKFLCIPAT